MAELAEPAVQQKLVEVGLVLDPLLEAGLPIKNPPKKTHLIKPTENVFLGFLFLFLIFYENNTNFSL